jgi:hypothetical protein
MTTKNRAISTRGSKTLAGRFFRLPCLLLALPLLIAGLVMRLTALIIPATLLLCCTLTVWLVRGRTVVSLNETGISYSSPFRKLHFPWRDVKSAGVYYVKGGRVFEHTATALPADSSEKHTIYVSTRPGYSPVHQRRLVNNTDMHFRWNAEAWAVIDARRSAAG